MKKMTLVTSVNFQECQIGENTMVFEHKGLIYAPMCTVTELGEALAPSGVAMPTYKGSIAMEDIFVDPADGNFNWRDTKLAKMFTRVAESCIVPLIKDKTTPKVCLSDLTKILPNLDSDKLLPELKWIKQHYTDFTGGYIDEWLCNVWGLLNFSDESGKAPKPSEVDDSFPYKVNDVVNYRGVVMTITAIKGSKVTLTDDEGDAVTKKKSVVLKALSVDDEETASEVAEPEVEVVAPKKKKAPKKSKASDEE